MTSFTPGPYSLHPYSTPEWMSVGAGKNHGPFQSASLAIGAGAKIVGFVQAQTPTAGYPQVDSLDEMRANHALFCAAPDILRALEKAAARFEHCAQMIEQGFNCSGTLRAERAMKAQHYALEARAAIALAREQSPTPRHIDGEVE